MGMHPRLREIQNRLDVLAYTIRQIDRRKVATPLSEAVEEVVSLHREAAEIIRNAKKR